VLNFVLGDSLDLVGITATGTTLGANNVLTVQEGKGPGGGSFTLDLDATQNYTGDTFTTAADGHGGTDITITTPATELLGIGYIQPCIRRYDSLKLVYVQYWLLEPILVGGDGQRCLCNVFSQQVV
jgi:hypothetical protein